MGPSRRCYDTRRLKPLPAFLRDAARLRRVRLPPLERGPLPADRRQPHLHDAPRPRPALHRRGGAALRAALLRGRDGADQDLPAAEPACPRSRAGSSPSTWTQFAETAGRLTRLSLAALFAMAIATLLTMDRSLNVIWRVDRHRPSWLSVPGYTALLVLGPDAHRACTLWATSWLVAASIGRARHALAGGGGAAADSCRSSVSALGLLPRLPDHPEPPRAGAPRARRRHRRGRRVRGDEVGVRFLRPRRCRPTGWSTAPSPRSRSSCCGSTCRGWSCSSGRSSRRRWRSGETAAGCAMTRRRRNGGGRSRSGGAGRGRGRAGAAGEASRIGRPVRQPDRGPPAPPGGSRRRAPLAKGLGAGRTGKGRAALIRTSRSGRARSGRSLSMRLVARTRVMKPSSSISNSRRSL